MAEAEQKTVRIIAYAAGNVQSLKTVNVMTNKPIANEYPTCTQTTGAPSPAGAYPTYMAAGAANTKGNGLPCIYVAGYTAPG